jgi:superfamily II DNA or RNA helicase
VTAPQVLDEGVDVPAADLAVILASSRSRRQMIQRMGRVLRRKPERTLARFVIVHVEGTVEDPSCGAHETFLDG